MIVVAGEALIDLIPAASGDLSINSGGGPFNTARWLGRLGADTAFLGAISTDPLGQRLRDELVGADVALDLVTATSWPTTLAMAQLDPAGVADYRFYTQSTSVGDLTPDQARDLLPERLDALYLGGLALVLEPVASALVAAVDLAHQRGAAVMIDPNVRASLIDDRARYRQRLDALLAQTDVLKLSVEDAAWLEPEESPEVTARGLLERGPGVVLLTAGARGVTILTAEAEWTVPAVAVQVLDTIGAGDAFSAGFLIRWLADPNALDEAARFGVEVAGVACTRHGATPPADLALR